MGLSRSTPSDGDHDLELVPVREQRARVRAARHDLAVALHRHLLAHQIQRGEQGGDLDRPLEAVRLAVDRHLDHRVSMIRYSPSITRLPLLCTRLRARHHSQPQVIAPTVTASATKSDANTNVRAKNTRASMADRMRWIMAAIMPRRGRRKPGQ